MKTDFQTVFGRAVRWFPWLVFIFLGVALKRTRGHLDEAYLWGMAGVLALYAVCPLPRPRPAAEGSVAPAFTLLFCAWTAINHQVLLVYADVSAVVGQITAALRASFGLFSLGVIATVRGIVGRLPSWLAPALLVTGIAVAFVARGLVPYASPHPLIDVFTVSSRAADYFIDGMNPYRQQFPDLYAGQYGYPACFTYWPGHLYWAALHKVFFGDIRFGFVIAELGTACALFRIGQALKISRVQTLMVIGAWVSFPPALFVLEQSWIDPSLILWASLCVVSVKRRNVWLAGLCAGMALSIKQYAVVFVGLLGLYFLLTGGRRVALRFALAAAVIFVLCVGPLFANDPSAFYESTIGFFIRVPPRVDALSFDGLWLKHFGVEIPRAFLLIPLAFTLSALVALVRRRTLTAWARATAVTYAGIFLFAKYAFCNYYVLVAFFVLLEAFTSLEPA